jgi:hypothetical protein
VSNALGIASVTHVLKDLLNDGLINHNVSAAVGSVVTVSSLSPGQVESQQGSANTQLNLFMYRVSYNTGWNNIGYPSRGARGEPISNPPLALNLHYLLTAYGEDELHAEILLGYAMQLLHENPVIDRKLIRNPLSVATLTTPGGRLPSNLLALGTSNLAEQIEQIKITPEPLNTEEMSKLWTAFQAKYRPCTAYLATVVLIESDRPAVSPLPVMRRNVYAVPFRQPVINKILSSPPYWEVITSPLWETTTLYSQGAIVVVSNNVYHCIKPHISGDFAADLANSNWEVITTPPWEEETNYSVGDIVVVSNNVYRCLVAHTSSKFFANDLASSNVTNATISEFRRIVTGDILVLEGEQLKSDGVKVKIGNEESEPNESNVTGTRIRIKLDADLGLKAGIHGVQVMQPIVVKEVGTGIEREFKGAYSNLQAFVLSPTITNRNVVLPSSTDTFLYRIDIGVSPDLRDGQRVMLILNETNLIAGVEPVSYSFILPTPNATPANSVTFEIKSDIKAGKYLIRIQVDGAASPLTTNANGEFIGPTLTIP